MTTQSARAAREDLLLEVFARRRAAGEALVAESEALARACRALADRFRAGGRLLVFGTGSAAADAQHVAVEFLHPVIVGKRALPALALTTDAALLTDVADAEGADEMFAGALRVLGAPADIALGLSLDGRSPSVTRGLRLARQQGMLTLALGGGRRDAPVPAAAEHRIVVPSSDVLAVKEALVTAYHILWELVHVFLDAPPGDRCETCGDVATPARVIALTGGDHARVEHDGATTDVSLELVDARVGDVVLVHAGVAIGVMP